MKWWFSSWNLFLFSLSKVCRISSADCFYSGFTASQSTLFCRAKYSVLYFAWIVLILLPICFQSFLSLRRVISIVIFHKILSPFKFFTHHYNWIFTVLNFVFFLKIFWYFFVASNPQIGSLHINKDTKIQKFGVSRKIFLPYIQGHEISKYKRLKNLLHYKWTFRYRKCKVFRKKLKHSPNILDICIHVCGGACQTFSKSLLL